MHTALENYIEKYYLADYFKPHTTRAKLTEMKKLLLCLTGFFFFISAGNSQTENYSQEYGKVTQYEMSMTEYKPDKDAEAVVLYEYGKNFFVPDYNKGGFRLYMQYFIKIKVLKQAGIEYAEFEIPYYVETNDMELVTELKGTTYNMENNQLTETPLNSRNIYEENYGKTVRVKKFAMPDVREGSVIELKYTIETPWFFNMREWKFQKKIPVVYSCLDYKAIPYYEYTYIMKGADKFDEFVSEAQTSDIQFGTLTYREMLYTFGMKNLPAFKDEEFISSTKDYMVSINFQVSKIHNPRGGATEIMSTWKQLNEEYLKDNNFGRYIKNSEKESKKVLETLDLTELTEAEQVKLISDYVRFNYNWNGRNDKFATNKLADFLKQKTGNTADINLYLTGMLRAAGIEATPVVLSTRNNGAVSLTHPFSKFLNYVIVHARANDTTYLIDATESALAFDELPERCTNVMGLLVKPKSDEWIDILQKKLAVTEKDFKVKINEPVGKLGVQTNVTAHSFDSYYYRSNYQGKEENLREFLRNKETELIGEIKVENYADTEQPFVFTYQSEPQIEELDGKFFIKPFLNQSVTDNIFKQTKRTLPVDLIYLRAAKFTSTIEIPEGYKVEYLPNKLNTNNILMKIEYDAIENNNKIIVTAYYEFKHAIYDAKFYNILKVSYEGVVKKFNEMIVLAKSGE